MNHRAGSRLRWIHFLRLSAFFKTFTLDKPVPACSTWSMRLPKNLREAVIAEVLALLCKLGLHSGISLNVSLDRPHSKTHKHMIQTQFTTEEAQNIRLNPVTDTGTPAKLDGAPVWTVVSGDVTLRSATDGLSCLVISGSDVGESIVQVDADADLGAGVTDLQVQFTVDIIHANATNLGPVLDAPVAKPTPAPTDVTAKAAAAKA